eukprot:COSAG05_NODE_1324_length_5186_cov_10.020244_1_plen_250_part_10
MPGPALAAGAPRGPGAAGRGLLVALAHFMAAHLDGVNGMGGSDTEILETFKQTLGAKNGVAARNWTFTMARAASTSGAYSDAMVEACGKLSMKPVCDHPRYCRTDCKAVYLGQIRHIAYPPHRNNNNYMPAGFAAIASKWTGLCSYTANANRNYAVCNIPTNTYTWRTASQANPGFMCANSTWSDTDTWSSGGFFKQTLGAKNGVAAREWTFTMARAASTSGAYSDAMVKACGKLSMKPVCDHPRYCRTD